MDVKTNTLVPISEVGQNSSKIARMVDEVQNEEVASNEDVLTLSKRFIEKNKMAYEALAK